jgi:hypothetical protein
MSTLTAASPGHADTGSSYAQNVGRATRALLAALFAVVPRASASSRADRITSRDLSRLYRMAGQYDSVMPNLAQELRAIAARAN